MLRTLRPPRRKTHPMIRGLAALAIATLVGYIATEGPVLYDEVRALQVQWSRLRTTRAIGFHEINPHPTHAERPDPWAFDKDGETWLWSGWTPGVGHTWFRTRRGDLDPRRLSRPLGRDTIRAIDRPLFELAGGTRWDRIPRDALVASVRLGERPTVYPLLVLQNVLVINDGSRNRPVLVVFEPFATLARSIGVYDPALGDGRVMMALTGYLYEGKPLLFDRETESFWLPEADGLVAITGLRKGTRLPRLAELRPSPGATGSPRTPTAASSSAPRGRRTTPPARSQAVIPPRLPASTPTTSPAPAGPGPLTRLAPSTKLWPFTTYAQFTHNPGIRRDPRRESCSDGRSAASTSIRSAGARPRARPR